jgi:KDO2-lipid IV(A) lauroyltransferase
LSPKRAAERAAVRLATAVSARLSDRSRARLGRVAAHLYLRLARKRRSIALGNLRRALPSLPPEEIEGIARRCAESFGSVLFDFLAASGFSREELKERVSLEGVANYLDSLKRGKGVFLLSAHFGNWEIGALAAGLVAGPIASVVRPLDNPLLERDLARLRGIFGNRVIAKRNAAREILRELKDGTTVAILIDQNVLPREAIFVDFLGRPAATSPALALLQKKTDAAVVPVLCRPQGFGRYCLRFERPITLEEIPERERTIEGLTRRYTEFLEEAVRAEPEHWLWMHNRWRTRPPGESR